MCPGGAANKASARVTRPLGSPLGQLKETSPLLHSLRPPGGQRQMTEEKQMEAKALWGPPPLPGKAEASTLVQNGPVLQPPRN